MNSEFLSPFEPADERAAVERRSARMLAVEVLGPLTILGGCVWAIAQPYRIAFLDPTGKGFYDWLIEPPLLVVIVGLLFTFLIAPGLVEDLRKADGTES